MNEKETIGTEVNKKETTGIVVQKYVFYDYVLVFCVVWC